VAQQHFELLQVTFRSISRQAMAPNMARKRLQQELNNLSSGKNPLPEGITAETNTNNELHWTATIQGPPDSPYEAGVFTVDLTFPEDYPFKAPAVVFTTQICHPNITPAGQICLDVLKDNWSPSYNIGTVLQQLQGLLAAPNADHPLVREPAVMMNTDLALFQKTAREYTLKYATPNPKQFTQVAPMDNAPKEFVVDPLATTPVAAQAFVESPCIAAEVQGAAGNATVDMCSEALAAEKEAAAQKDTAESCRGKGSC